MDKYNLCTVAPAVLDFLQDLNNWYIRFNRTRLKGAFGDQEAYRSLSTLFRVMMDTAIMLASFMPFLTETIYQNLRAVKDMGQSVHFLAFPTVEEGLLDPKRVVQIGIRGSLYMSDMWEFSYDSGMRVMLIEEVEDRGWKACIDEAREIVGDMPIYVSFDIDSLDPAYAPGTGTPEAGGLSMREAQGMCRKLEGLNIVGADMVEVSPPFDVGGVTALNGANIMYELLCVMAGR